LKNAINYYTRLNLLSLNNKTPKMTPEALSNIRKDYTLHSLNEEDVTASPIEQFAKWWEDAAASQIVEMNAMTVATADSKGIPDARIVLLKAFDEKGFVFFTNYNSAKSKQLEENPNATLLFFWKELERQVRISGVAEKITLKESIDYFDSRPEGSKIGAWSSPQSMVVAGKAFLKETFDYYAERFKHGAIPKPPHWGGYRIKPSSIEFWQGRPSRMHDRILYTETTSETWKIERLAP
jgi:pyridoxamine 5'-phosphate oxidase